MRRDAMVRVMLALGRSLPPAFRRSSPTTSTLDGSGSSTRPLSASDPSRVLVGFTVVTTLLWGRVFCGYLCQFGAFQDLLEHAIPRRLRRRFPHPVHESGLFVKYGVLGIVLFPAMVGSEASLFEYFEPFRTVFFWSTSMVLWGIAIAILTACTIIPRFYCRYLQGVCLLQRVRG